MQEKLHTCCFIGHRKIEETPALIQRLTDIIQMLIEEKGVHTFLFGDKSEFNSLCLSVVTAWKETYPHIQRIYVRAAYPWVSDTYKKYLLDSYDDTYYPTAIENSGKAAYVERNRQMLDRSDFCVFYYDESYLPPRRKSSKKDMCTYQPKSGTRLAYLYAEKNGLMIFNVFD